MLGFKKLWPRRKKRGLRHAAPMLAPPVDPEPAPDNADGALENLTRVAVRRVATPRADIAWMSLYSTFKDALTLHMRHKYSHYPVCNRGLDQVVGAVDGGQLWAARRSYRRFALRDILEPVVYVAGNASCWEALCRLYRKAAPMALVLDEHGGVDGLVRPTDMLRAAFLEPNYGETLAGTYHVQPLPSGGWEVDGRMPLDTFYNVYLRPYGAAPELGEGSVLPETVAGYVLGLAGRVPEIGATLEDRSGLRFEIVDSTPRQLRRLRVIPSVSTRLLTAE